MTAGPAADRTPDVATLELSAPAKVNLGLRVLGRREDGYHLLESLFVPLALADRVTLELRSRPVDAPAVGLRLAGPWSHGVPCDSGNLAVRAAEGFLAQARRPDLALRIALDKHIPAQAGLGGGSSDAGAVLRGLATLLPGALGPAALAALAVSLGADVPFFLAPRPARVTGIGERIEPLAGVPVLHLLLVRPRAGLATAEVYAAHDALRGALTAREAGPSLRPPSGALDGAALARCLEGLLANDLEAAARRLCPLLARLRRRILELGALAVGMSGSGPTLFGVFPDEAGAREACRAARSERQTGGDLDTETWLHATRTRTSGDEPDACPAGAPRAGGSGSTERTDGASPNW